MSALGIVVSVLILGPMWGYLVWAALQWLLKELRWRRTRRIALSPILTHGQMTRRQVRRAMKRAGYVEMDTPLGKHRMGMN